MSRAKQSPFDRLLTVEGDDEDGEPRPRKTAQPDVEDEHDDQV